MFWRMPAADCYHHCREVDSAMWHLLQEVAKVEASRLQRLDRRKQNEQGYREAEKERTSLRASLGINASSCSNSPTESTCLWFPVISQCRTQPDRDRPHLLSHVSIIRMGQRQSADQAFSVWLVLPVLVALLCTCQFVPEPFCIPSCVGTLTDSSDCLDNSPQAPALHLFTVAYSGATDAR
jgi:hypothetical protein